MEEDSSGNPVKWSLTQWSVLYGALLHTHAYQAISESAILFWFYWKARDKVTMIIIGRTTTSNYGTTLTTRTYTESTIIGTTPTTSVSTPSTDEDLQTILWVCSIPVLMFFLIICIFRRANIAAFCRRTWNRVANLFC